MTKVFIILILSITTFYVVLIFLGLTTDPLWGQITFYLVRIALIITIFLIALLVVRVLRRISRRARIKATGEKALPSAMEFTTLMLSYAVYIISAILILIIILDAAGINALVSIESFFLQNEARIGLTAAIVIAIYFIAKLVETVLEDFKFRSKKFNPQVIDLLETGIKYALFIIALLTVIFSVFVMIGEQTVGLILVGVTLIFLTLGIVLFYSTIQNIVSGLALMDTSPFDIGDRIMVLNGMICDVIEKGLVFTKVKTLEGEIVDVPNAEIIEERIYNYSRSATHGVSIFIDISYTIPNEEVHKVAKQAIEELEGILKEPKPEVFATEMRGKNIRYEVLVFTKEVHRDREVRSELITKIQEIFREEGYKVIYE